MRGTPEELEILAAVIASNPPDQDKARNTVACKLLMREIQDMCAAGKFPSIELADTTWLAIRCFIYAFGPNEVMAPGENFAVLTALAVRAVQTYEACGRPDRAKAIAELFKGLRNNFDSLAGMN